MKKLKKIVVAGDVTFDCFQWILKPVAEEKIPNWKSYPSFHSITREGGSLLLKNMLKIATSSKVISYTIPASIKNLNSDNLIYSYALLGEYQYSKNDDKIVYRIKEFNGFSGPKDNTQFTNFPLKDDNDADLVVLDDAGNYFRRNKENWPKIINSNEKPTILLKMCGDLFNGELWDFLISKHSDNLIIILNANDLREYGINISKKLSWERTAQDFMLEIKNNPKISKIKKCPHVIIRLGLEGAIYYTNNHGEVQGKLFYDPYVSEDGYYEQFEGIMQGFNNAFTAALASKIVENGTQDIPNGIKKGIISTINLLKYGLGLKNEKGDNKPDYPFEKIFNFPSSNINRIKSVVIPDYDTDKNWTILESQINNVIYSKSKDLVDYHKHKKCGLFSKESLACEYVINGKTSYVGCIPSGIFGKLKTADKNEIENYQSVRNLLKEYIATENPRSPLSIAVFGQPGSGKSFGVTQLAKSIDSSQITKMVFNVAQWTSQQDLINSLHKVTDQVLRDKIPLVFFDEFDSNYEKEQLGWLKFFLAPMQDCKYKDGETMHPIGKSIFVFAGGTSPNIQHFSREQFDRQLTEEELKIAHEIFKRAKGPDFLSRLRGYINILGPNWAGGIDSSYIFRRGIFLRSILEMKNKNIFNGNKLSIDHGVLRAFLRIPHYKHGVRSMEAIIDMSILADKKKFEVSALPINHLDLHVNKEQFMNIVLRDRLFEESIENLSREIYQQSLQNNAQKKEKYSNIKPWEVLDESIKDSNRRKAQNIIDNLHNIGYDYIPKVKGVSNSVKFTEAEFEILAEMEHDRWTLEKISNGWIYGPEKDVKLKTTPFLVHWHELSDIKKSRDRDIASKIPDYLEKFGLELYSLK